MSGYETKISWVAQILLDLLAHRVSLLCISLGAHDPIHVARPGGGEGREGGAWKEREGREGMEGEGSMVASLVTRCSHSSSVASCIRTYVSHDTETISMILVAEARRI